MDQINNFSPYSQQSNNYSQYQSDSSNPTRGTITQPPPPLNSPNFPHNPNSPNDFSRQTQMQSYNNRREKQTNSQNQGNQIRYNNNTNNTNNTTVNPNNIQYSEQINNQSSNKGNNQFISQGQQQFPSQMMNTPIPPQQITSNQTQFAQVNHSNNYSQNVSIEVALTDQGTRLKLMGNLEGAMNKYIEASEINSDYAPAYYNIGVIYSELNRYEEALNGYQSALLRNPYYVEAYCNIGVIYKNTGELKSAVHYYKKALAVNPNFKIARNNMAIVLTDLGTQVKNDGKVRESIEYYKQALVYNALYPDAYYNLGVAYGEQGMLDKAIVCYELGIHFNPVCCEAYNNLGVIFKDSDNLERATECYKSALQINHKFSQTLNNLGVVFTMQGKLDEAYKYVKEALESNPRYAEAYNNLGVLYRDEGKMAEAIFCYDSCLKLNPNSRNAAQNRLLALNYCNNDNVRVYEAHRQWGINFQNSFQTFPSYNVTMKTDKQIRIGYMSPDFFTHSISYFIEGILCNHDHDRFHIICYSNVVKEDTVTHHLKTFACEWRYIYGKPAIEVSNMIYEDRIDILVELTGHTAGNRLDVSAMKPAPIQISYLGYPNTTGLDTIDYRFTDEYADPVHTKQQYTEELIRFPNGYLCYTPPSKIPDITPLPYLKNNYITFGSFNNLAKITPEVFLLWSRVLLAIPNSRLVMKCKPFASEVVKQRILYQFVQNGIDASRINLIPLLQSNFEHLSAYELMDISLDSFPYAGTTTTCESLLMGVPTITLRGPSHSHNIGVSLLNAVNMKQWIASTEDEYIRIAATQANNIENLQNIRSNLRDILLNSSLCQSANFTKTLEGVYRDLWCKFVER